MSVYKNKIKMPIFKNPSKLNAIIYKVIVLDVFDIFDKETLYCNRRR